MIPATVMSTGANFRGFIVLLCFAISACHGASAHSGVRHSLGPLHAHALRMGLNYRLDESWPAKTDVIDGLPFSVGVDQVDGVVYVLQRQGKSTVLVLDGKTGREIGNWTAPSNLDTPHGLRLQQDASGVNSVWITDVGNTSGHVIRRFSKEGHLMETMGTPGTSGSSLSPLEFGNVAELTFAAYMSHEHAGKDYDFYVVDGDGGPNNHLLKFNGAGNDFTLKWVSGSKGSQLGQLDIPHDVDSDAHGRVWVADRANARLQVFDASNGKALGQLTCMSPLEPYGVRVLPQTSTESFYLAISSVSSHSVSILEVPLSDEGHHFIDECHVIQSIKFNTTSSPHLLDVEYKTGILFVADITSAKVYKLVPSP